MWLNPQFPADLVTLLKKSLMENFIFCAVNTPENFCFSIVFQEVYGRTIVREWVNKR